MNEFAVMPLEHYDAACDALREKLGSTGLITSDRLAQLIQSITGTGKTISKMSCEVRTASGFFFGDANKDGIINEDDVTQILQYVVNPNSADRQIIDLNSDGMITNADAQALSGYLSKLGENQILAKITVTFIDNSASVYYVPVDKIESENTGIDTSDATAMARYVLASYTFYANGEKLTGTMPDRSGMNVVADETSGMSATTEPSLRLVLPIAGYYNETSGVLLPQNRLATILGLTADKIAKGNTVLGIEGTGGGTDKEISKVTVIAQTSSGNLLGDVNGDRAINNMDSIAISKYMQGDITDADIDVETADLNGDCIVNDDDNNLLMKNVISGIKEGQILVKVVIEFTDGSKYVDVKIIDVPSVGNNLPYVDDNGTLTFDGAAPTVDDNGTLMF